MANYSLVINSRFRPFSYQEMLAPTLQSTQAHQALEDAYNELGMQAGTVEAMLNKVLDGKITLQESDLDAFNFETVNYEIVEEVKEEVKEENTIIDVTPIAVNKTSKPNKSKKSNSTMFEIDNDFMTITAEIEEEKEEKEEKEKNTKYHTLGIGVFLLFKEKSIFRRYIVYSF